MAEHNARTPHDCPYLQEEDLRIPGMEIIVDQPDPSQTDELTPTQMLEDTKEHYYPVKSA